MGPPCARVSKVQPGGTTGASRCSWCPGSCAPVAHGAPRGGPSGTILGPLQGAPWGSIRASRQSWCPMSCAPVASRGTTGAPHAHPGVVGVQGHVPPAHPGRSEICSGMWPAPICRCSCDASARQDPKGTYPSVPRRHPGSSLGSTTGTPAPVCTGSHLGHTRELKSNTRATLAHLPSVMQNKLASIHNA